MNKPHLEHETIDGKTYWFASSQRANPPGGPKKPTAHLLPNYDEYLIAYKNRSAFFDATREITFFGEVLRRHIVVVDGQVVGGWHSTTNRDEVTIEGTLLVQLIKPQRLALEKAATAYGRFLGKDVSSRLTASG